MSAATASSSVRLEDASQAHGLATRVAAAAAASAAAVVLVTPLDVIKVSMQAAFPSPHHGHSTGHVRLSSLASSSCTDARPSLCLRHLEGSSLSATAGHLHLHHSSSACSHVTRAAAASSSALCQTCSPHALSSLAVAWHAPAAESRPTALGTVANILRKERVTSLWRGLDMGLLLSVPVVSIHIPLYDYLNARLSDSMGAYSPAVAGMAARAVAVVTTAPLEVLRTRKQSSAAKPAAAPSRQLSTLAPPHFSAAHGVYAARRTPKRPAIAGSSGTAAAAFGNASASLLRGEAWLGRRAAAFLADKWVGTAATLWRDVPFSGLYWMLTEPLRAVLLSHLQRTSQAPRSASPLTAAAASDLGDGVERSRALLPPSVGQVLCANFFAGALAGGLAAAITTPFDVVKTRQQTAGLLATASRVTGPAHSQSPALRALLPPLPGALISGKGTGGTFEMLRSIYASQGARGLYIGMGPRSARAMLACGTVIAGYESIKLLLL